MRALYHKAILLYNAKLRLFWGRTGIFTLTGPSAGRRKPMRSRGHTKMGRSVLTPELARKHRQIRLFLRRLGMKSELKKNFGDQVVVVGFGDLATIELAGHGREAIGKVGDVKLAVDFRGMHGGTGFEEQIAFLRWALE